MRKILLALALAAALLAGSRGHGGRISGHDLETGSAARPVQPGRRSRISLERTRGQAQDLLHLRRRQRGRHRHALGALEPWHGRHQQQLPTTAAPARAAPRPTSTTTRSRSRCPMSGIAAARARGRTSPRWSSPAAASAPSSTPTRSSGHGSLVIGGWIGGISMRRLILAVGARGQPAHRERRYRRRVGTEAAGRPRRARLESGLDPAVVPRRPVQSASRRRRSTPTSSWRPCGGQHGGKRSAHGTGRVSWAQPGPGGNGISRQAPVTVTLSAVATHGGRRYFSRLAFSFTWRGHTVSTPGPRGSRTRAATQPGAGLPPAPPSHYTALLQPRCTRGGMKMSQLFKWCSARIVMVTAFGTVTGICG